MITYRVTAPYVVLRVKDSVGLWSVKGFYAGAILAKSDVDDASLERHVGRGWVEKVETAEPQAPAAEVEDEGDADAEDDGGGGGEGDTGGEAPGRPAQADNKAAWVDYAASQGIDRGEAEAMTKADLMELLK